jgi:excisionase family DNA binding protein
MVTIEMNGETYLSTTETSEYLGINKITLTRYVKRGSLKQYKRGFGRTLYFKKSDVEAFKDETSRMRPLEGD